MVLRQSRLLLISHHAPRPLRRESSIFLFSSTTTSTRAIALLLLDWARRPKWNVGCRARCGPPAESGLSGDFRAFADREQISTPEFVKRIAGATDKRARLFPMPIRALELFLDLMRQGQARDSLISSMELDVSKALATGWLPQLTMDEGLKIALSPGGGWTT
jgi:hypothetical protein